MISLGAEGIPQWQVWGHGLDPQLCRWKEGGRKGKGGARGKEKGEEERIIFECSMTVNILLTQHAFDHPSRTSSHLHNVRVRGVHSFQRCVTLFCHIALHIGWLILWPPAAGYHGHQMYLFMEPAVSSLLTVRWTKTEGRRGKILSLGSQVLHPASSALQLAVGL